MTTRWLRTVRPCGRDPASSGFCRRRTRPGGEVPISAGHLDVGPSKPHCGSPESVRIRFNGGESRHRIMQLTYRTRLCRLIDIRGQGRREPALGCQTRMAWQVCQCQTEISEFNGDTGGFGATCRHLPAMQPNGQNLQRERQKRHCCETRTYPD